MKIYVDVTNTVISRIHSGIQRVTKELLRRWLQDVDMECVLLHESPEKGQFFVLNTDSFLTWSAQLPDEEISQQLMSNVEDSLAVEQFENGSLFFDIDASWHNALERTVLLPVLKQKSITICKLHYDIGPIIYPEHFRPESNARYVAHFDAHLQYADLFFCISKQAAADVRKIAQGRGIAVPQTEVVRLGADFQERAYQVDSQTQQSEVLQRVCAQEKQYLLCVGTLEPRKNHGLLLDVFERIEQRFPWLSLVLVGRQGWMVEPLCHRIADHPLFEQRLFWFTGISDEELQSLYKNALLSVYPSFFEGFGLPVIESLRYGVPIICSRIETLVEAGGEFADYFDLHQASQLEELLVHYIDRGHFYHHKTEQLQNYQVPRWDSCAEHIVDRLKEVTANKTDYDQRNQPQAC